MKYAEKGRRYLRDLVESGRIKLWKFSEKYAVSMCKRFVWLQIGTSGLLWWTGIFGFFVQCGDFFKGRLVNKDSVACYFALVDKFGRRRSSQRKDRRTLKRDDEDKNNSSLCLVWYFDTVVCSEYRYIDWQAPNPLWRSFIQLKSVVVNSTCSCLHAPMRPHPAHSPR